MQALAHDVVLNVDVLVGRFVQGADALADGPDDQKDRRDEQQQDQAHHHVLAQRQNDAAEKQHGDRNETAGDHRRDPRDRADVIGRPGQQRSRAGADPNSRTGPQAKRHLAQLLDGKKHQQAQRVGGGVIHRFRIHPLCSKAMFVVCGNVHKMHLLLFVRIRF